MSGIFPLSQEKTFESFETYAPNVVPASKVSAKVSEDSVKTFEKTFEREVTSEPKDMKVSKVSVEDKGKVDIAEVLGMSVEQAIDVWTKAGKPVIHLYPGENCYGLDTLLGHSDILPRHLLAIRDWLSEQTAKVLDEHFFGFGNGYEQQRDFTFGHTGIEKLRDRKRPAGTQEKI